MSGPAKPHYPEGAPSTRKELVIAVAQILYRIDVDAYGGHSEGYPPRQWANISDHEKQSYIAQAAESLGYLRYLGLLKI
jgi:hypothetical protein